MVHLSVVFSRPPAEKNFLQVVDAETQLVRIRLEIWCAGDDGSDVEIPIRPSVKAMSDAGRQRIINCGMAEGELNADCLQTIAFEYAWHADDGVGFQQCERGLRLVEIG